MKVYDIDLRGLSQERREEIISDLDRAAFMIQRSLGPGGTIGIKVFWDSENDFLESSVFPKGCPCRWVG